MNTQSKSLALYGLILLALLIIVGLGWLSYRYASQLKGGRSFLAYWTSTRALIVDGESPYSAAAAQKIQQAIRNNSSETPYFTRVTFPLYAILFFLPFAFFADGILAQALWMVFLEICLGLLALACIRLSKWRMNAWNLPIYILFIITWFHSLIVLHEGSVVVLVAVWIAWMFAAIRNGQDELAGILLALTTIRPLLVLLPVIFVLLWAGAQSRWKLVVWFLGALVLLIFVGMFFMPDWLLQNIQAVFASLQPLYPMSPGAAFAFWWPGLGGRLGWILAAISAFVLLVEWWMAARVKEFRWFLWTACLTLVLGQWVGIRTEPLNYLVLLIPLTLVFSVWDERWRRGHLARTIIATVASMAILELVLWAIFLNGAKQGLDFHSMPVLLFPLPFFLIVTMYWVRWWAIRPPRLYVESLREQEVVE